MEFSIECKQCKKILYGPVTFCPFCGSKLDSINQVDQQKLDIPKKEVVQEEAKTPAQTAEVKPTADTPDTKETKSIVENSAPSGAFDVKESTKTADVMPPLAGDKPKKPINPVPKKHLRWPAIAAGVLLALIGLYYYVSNKNEKKLTPPTPSTQVTTIDVRQPNTTSSSQHPTTAAEQTSTIQTTMPTTIPVSTDEEIKKRVNQYLENGQKYFNTGDYASCISMMKAALRLDGDNVEAKALFSRARVKQKEVDSQKELLDILQIGKDFYASGKYQECISSMKLALQYDANNDEAKRYKKMAEDKLFTNPKTGRTK